jgi:hypothetical protein
MTITRIAISLVFLGLLLFIGESTRAAGNPFSDLKSDIAALQESVDKLAGGPPCGTFQRFVVSADGTEVCDNTTGIVWEQRLEATQRTFLEAVDRCSAKGPGWRLPEIKEFFTVVDYANFEPPFPTGHPFDVVAGNFEYWSRTPRADDLSEVWTFILDRGRTFNGPIIGGSDRVWCVRQIL